MIPFGKNWRLLAPLLAFLIAPAAANAADSPEWLACNGSEPQYTLDQQIAGCSWIIANSETNQARLADAFNDRCFSIAQSGKMLQDALADCNESLRRRAGDSGTLQSRCLVYLRLNQFDKAIADGNASIQADPKQSSAFYIRGLAKRRSGDVAGGDTDIATAKSLDPRVADAYTPYGVGP